MLDNPSLLAGPPSRSLVEQPEELPAFKRPALRIEQLSSSQLADLAVSTSSLGFNNLKFLVRLAPKVKILLMLFVRLLQHYLVTLFIILLFFPFIFLDPLQEYYRNSVDLFALQWNSLCCFGLAVARFESFTVLRRQYAPCFQFWIFFRQQIRQRFQRLMKEKPQVFYNSFPSL